MSPVVLLGPQRYRPTLAEVFHRLGAEGPVAAVTAGWEEREDEIDELSEHLGRDIVNLRLHARTEHIFERDPAFLAAWRARRLLLRRTLDMHRQRIHYQMEALRRLERRTIGGEALEEEKADALRLVRELDARQLARRAEIRAEFDKRHKPHERDAVAHQRQRVTELIDDCGSVAFAGGHVAVLLNRLLLFGIADLIGDRPLFAWSAGAMCASERVVIYHDNPPQGRGGFALMLERGLGLCPGVIAIPHASQRLDLHDRMRVATFAQRFAPRTCVALDDASGLMWEGGNWELLGEGARRLRTDGEVVDLQARTVHAG